MAVFIDGHRKGVPFYCNNGGWYVNGTKPTKEQAAFLKAQGYKLKQDAEDYSPDFTPEENPAPVEDPSPVTVER